MAREYHFAFPLRHGLHARPGAALRDVLLPFDCQATFTNTRNGHRGNAKALLALISTDTRHGDPCVLAFSGPQEDEAAMVAAQFIEGDYPLRDEPPPDTLGGPLPMPPRVLAVSGAEHLAGLPVSPGIGFGAPVVVGGFDVPDESQLAPAGKPEQELATVHAAIAALGAQMRERVRGAQGRVESDILTTHLSILEDPAYLEFVAGRIREGAGAGAAILAAGRHFGGMFQSSDSSYLRERVMDIFDVTTRLLECATGRCRTATPTRFDEPSVGLAFDLSPAQLLALDRGNLKGLVFENNTRTSHTAILANAFGIPCVAGVPNARGHLAGRAGVIVDGMRGIVVPDPPARVAHYYHAAAANLALRNERMREFRDTEARSADGRRMIVAANVGSLAETEAAIEAGAEGIGLFRTEFLFLERHVPPTEEEQFEVFRRVAQLAHPRTVIIRTLDAGGDKALPCLDLPRESNPFLGYRAVRFYRQHAALIRSHLRAILRAAARGNIWVMAPMVAGMDDAAAFMGLLGEAAESLGLDGLPPGLRVGCMIEVPSAAFAIAELADHFEFFSVGTNDLAQYFFAADRGNARVGRYIVPSAPAFLRFLARIADDVRASGRWLGMCGEMAGHARFLPLFLAMGFDEISMASPLVPAAKATLRSLSTASCAPVLAECLAAAGPRVVDAVLARAIGGAGPQAVVSEKLVLLDSAADSKEAAIREMVDLLCLDGRADDAELLEDAVWAREDTVPASAVDDMALQHCRAGVVRNDSLVLLRLRDPLDWGIPESGPVRTVLLLALCEADTPASPSALASHLARLMADAPFRGRLAATVDPASIADFVADRLQVPRG